MNEIFFYSEQCPASANIAKIIDGTQLNIAKVSYEKYSSKYPPFITNIPCIYVKDTHTIINNNNIIQYIERKTSQSDHSKAAPQTRQAPHQQQAHQQPHQQQPHQ